MNWHRKSTLGLTIDFPLLNVLGFLCYSISTCSFMYSPTIRDQYAARHPLSPEPTVQFNDVAFGVHAVVLVVLTYSQFFPGLWGFKVSPRQTASKPVLGIFWGSILSTLVVTAIVLHHSGWQQQDPQGWAWIDVVSLPLPPCGNLLNLVTALYPGLCKTHLHLCQIHPSGDSQFQPQVNRRLEY